MNKLASIFYIMRQGFPTLDVYLLNKRRPEKTIKEVYRTMPFGWVIRCGNEPDYNARAEESLPWGVAYTREELIEKTREIRRQIGDRLVFIHPQRKMDKAGNVLILPEGVVIIEACNGPYNNLAQLVTGKDDPQQHLVFRAGMIRREHEEGIEVLTMNDLLEIRNIERALITANPTSLTCFEFSFNGTRIDLHDIKAE